MVHLDALSGTHIERLVHGVGGIDAVVAAGMPGGIASGRLGAVGLGVEPLLHAVFLYEGAAVLTAYLQGDAVGVVLPCRVAVHAASGHGHLGEEGELVERVDVALVDTDVAAHLIAGRYAAVGESVVVEGILAHLDVEIVVLHPLAVFFGAYRQYEVSALVLFGEPVPCVDVEVGIAAAGMQFTTF